jgi:hypothetical protein
MYRLIVGILMCGLSANAQTFTETFGGGTNQFSITFVRIGSPNNGADTNGSPNPVGGVSYTYNIGKYEISRDIIEKANSAGNLGIQLHDLSDYGGNATNKPATFIDWYSASKIANYLNISSGYVPAYKYDNSGNLLLWSSSDPGYNPKNPLRNSLAKYFLPSSDEWYKAAYGSPNGNWYKYANGSNVMPTAVASGSTGAVYSQPLQNGPAEASNAGGLSAYGTMGQNGNALEWTETAFDGLNDSPNEYREMRGASWISEWYYLDSSWRTYFTPSDAHYDFGFRVASLPDPNCDTDGDGVCDALEISDRTDPLSSTSFNAKHAGLVLFFPFEGNLNNVASFDQNHVASNVTFLSDMSDGNEKAAYFEDAWIDCGNRNSNYRLTNDFTVSLWAYPTEYPHQWNPLLSKRESGFGYDWCLYYTWTEKTIRYTRRNSAGETTMNLVAPCEMNTNTWYHIVLSRKGSSYTFYINGNPVTAVQEGNEPEAYWDASDNLRIGILEKDDPNKWRGKLDQVRIYNKCLNNTEVADLYLEEVGSLDSNTDGIQDGRAFTLGYSREFNFAPLLDSLKDMPTPGLYNQSQYISNRVVGRNDVLNSPNSYNLYSANQIHNLGFGGIVLNRDTNNQLTLNYQVLQSSDLQNWTLYQNVTLPITNAPTDKMFLRVQAVGQ